MPLQRERLSKKLFTPRWIRHEHLARYQFAACYVKDKVVVDCACGEGGGAEIFLNAGAKEVCGFDLSGEAIAAAQSRNGPSQLHPPQPAGGCRPPDFPAGLHFQVADGSKLPLKDRFADVYVALETLEHLKDPESFLKEARRVLKPEGLFIASTPNRIITNPGKQLSDKPWNRFHLREYSRPEWRDLMYTSFSQVESYGQNLQPDWKVQLLRSWSGDGAVRLNQLMKLPRWLFDRLEDHTVWPSEAETEDEYLIALCREPRNDL